MRLKRVQKSVRKVVRRAKVAGDEMLGKLREGGKSLLRRAQASVRAFRDAPAPRVLRRRIVIVRRRRVTR